MGQQITVPASLYFSLGSTGKGAAVCHSLQSLLLLKLYYLDGCSDKFAVSMLKSIDCCLLRMKGFYLVIGLRIRTKNRMNNLLLFQICFGIMIGMNLFLYLQYPLKLTSNSILFFIFTNYSITEPFYT